MPRPATVTARYRSGCVAPGEKAGASIATANAVFAAPGGIDRRALICQKEWIHPEIEAGFRSAGIDAAVIAAISPCARSGLGRAGIFCIIGRRRVPGTGTATIAPADRSNCMYIHPGQKVVQARDPELGRLTELEIAARRRYLRLKDGTNDLGLAVGGVVDDTRVIRTAERLWHEAAARLECYQARAIGWHHEKAPRDQR